MSILHAIILGITQGLTEFLPISSSGHLILVRWAFGWSEQSADLAKTFDVALHLGTLIAVVGYFWRDVLTYIKAAPGLFSAEKRQETNTRIAWALIVSAIPGALVGAVLADAIEERLGGAVVIAFALLIGAALMYLADRLVGTRDADTFSYRDGGLLGAAQAVALQPGISRAGVTMTAARALGYRRDAAARVSFLMSIPIIAGAVVFKTVDVVQNGIPTDMRAAFVVGIISAAASGALAIAWLLKYLRSHSFMPFVIYRVVVAVLVLIVAATPWR